MRGEAAATVDALCSPSQSDAIRRTHRVLVAIRRDQTRSVAIRRNQGHSPCSRRLRTPRLPPGSLRLPLSHSRRSSRRSRCQKAIRERRRRATRAHHSTRDLWGSGRGVVMSTCMHEGVPFDEGAIARASRGAPSQWGDRVHGARARGRTDAATRATRSHRAADCTRSPCCGLHSGEYESRLVG